MIVSDKELIRFLDKAGPKTSNELYQLLKKSYPQIDKYKVIQRLKRLRKKSHIRVTNKGKIIPQISLKKHERDDDLPKNDFFEVCRKYEYKNFFKRQQLAEANKIKEINPTEIKHRKDYRKDLVVTIDGEDAKDLDDGISVEKKFTHYLLKVHIADVSYYVKENSYLDIESEKRGNSVYLVDKVVPMLPEALSNGICSLNEKVDRLTMSVEIKFDKKGNILDYSFFQGIIQVKKRYTYNRVQEILDVGKALDKDDKPFLKPLKIMKDLAMILYNKRKSEGGIDFNFDEVKIICDSKSFPVDVQKRKRLFSHQIIEEFMLSANKVAARLLDNKGKGIYRVHETPDLEKIKEFNRFIQKFGYRMKDPMKPASSQLQSILSQVSGKEEEKLISVVLLRTMKQAVYSTENKGHFALSFKDYTHFTSPIRRYADLVVHRLLKDALGIKTEIRLAKQDRYLTRVALHISTTERTAMEAEREIIKKKSARFMKNKVGEVFEGTISGVTSFGMFVEMVKYGIEGMVRLADLKGFYIFDEENYRVYRKDNKVSYQLGSKVRATLIKVDVKRNFIDLILTD